MTLDEFKETIKTNKSVADNIYRRTDIIDMDNGTMLIYAENINKYLEKYACKDAEDLSNTLWYSYGVYVKIVD